MTPRFDWTPHELSLRSPVFACHRIATSHPPEAMAGLGDTAVEGSVAASAPRRDEPVAGC